MYRLHFLPGTKVENIKKIIRHDSGGPEVISGSISSIELPIRVPEAQCIQSQRQTQNLAPKIVASSPTGYKTVRDHMFF